MIFNNIFTFPDISDNRYDLAVKDYRICLVLAAIVLIIAAHAVFTLIFRKNEYRRALIGVITSALPYLPVMIAVALIKLPQGFLTNDEYAIYNDATNLIHDTWFNIMTVYYYIVSLILIPYRYAPIIMKLVIEFFVVGYTVWRTKEHFGKKAGMFMYILFLLYPVIAYTTSAHRLPVYFLIYLAVIVKLLYDGADHRKLTYPGAVFVLFAGSVLTQWRTEGIYLVILIPVLMLIAYPGIRRPKVFLPVVILYLAFQTVLWIPQNGAVSGNLDGAANDRMKPFYAYTITNMYRNGLDLEKNADDLAIVDRYLSLDAIRAINEHYEDINYEDVLILYQEGFVGVRPEAGDAEFVAYSEALKRIFKNNPDVFARTRWGAFCYAAVPYHISFDGSGLHGLASSAFGIVKSFAYNLFIPVGFALVMCIISLIRKKWFEFFMFGGLMAHWAIVFVLAPASYFKYYFPIYITSYFYLIYMIIGYFTTRRRTEG